MSILKTTDSILKLINSVLFRLIIVLYAITLLVRFENIFEIKWYVVAIAIYFFLYLKLFNKHKFLSFLRLLNDYVFISFVLYSKPLNDLHTSLFLLLPLINNLNYSGNRKIQPFSIRLYLLIVFAFLVLNGLKFDWTFVAPLISISLINLLIYMRLYLMDYSNNLYSIIDEFYQDNLNIGKTHIILKEVIKKHKENKFVSNWVPVESIILFKLKEVKGLQILLSSRFVVEFKLIGNEDFSKNILDKGLLKNVSIILNNKLSENNLFLLRPYKNNDYLFFVEFSKRPLVSVALDIYINKVLLPLLTKIAKVTYVEYELELENKKYFRELKNRLENIDSAVNAIHYLNNKLSPVLNYFEMLRLLPDIDPLKKEPFMELIEKEKKNAINSIKPITEKMNQMAEKTMNANIISDTVPIKLRKVFALIRKSCDNNDSVKFEYNVEWPDEIFERIIISNTNLLTFVLDEILINLDKHSRGECEIKFLNYDYPEIYFSNTVMDLDRNKNVLNKVIEDFNQDNINEIMKRSSNGLRIIKQYLLQLNIKHRMSLINDKLELVLRFENESRNI